MAPHPAVVACCRVLNGVARVNPGTAACVGHRDGFAYLLTAAHVLPPDQGQTFQFFPPGGGDAPARVLVGCEVLVRQDDPDLALVRLPADPPLPVVPLVGRGKRPKVLPTPAGAVGCPAGKPPEYRDEVVLGRRLVRRPGGLRFFWETEGKPVGGMSGGPLLDRAGAVIGVCSAADLGTGRGYFSHADEVLAAVAEAGHRWLLDAPAGPDRR